MYLSKVSVVIGLVAGLAQAAPVSQDAKAVDNREAAPQWYGECRPDSRST